MSNTIEVESMDEMFKEPAPVIAAPESVIVELQRGLINPTTGQWQTTAEVRELNGKDEEFLASLDHIVIFPFVNLPDDLPCPEYSIAKKPNLFLTAYCLKA